MKLKYEFEIMNIDEDIIAVPTSDNADGFHGVLRVNESAVFILDCLKEDTTEDEIVDKILAEYEGDRAEITEFVHDYIKELNAAELLV